MSATIRPARPEDAEGLARVYLESAEYHAQLDSERYSVPGADAIASRYRENRQHAGADGRTFVAEISGDIVGFVDARLDRSPDPMHRDMTYCHIVEIAVAARHQRRGIGAQLVRAAEDWGRARGAALASLEYLAANARAAAFYRDIGYAPGAVTAIKRL